MSTEQTDNKYFSDGEFAVLTVAPDKIRLEDTVQIKNLNDPITDPEELKFAQDLLATGACVTVPEDQLQFKTAKGLGSSRVGQGHNLDLTDQARMTPEEVENEKNGRAIDSLRAVLASTIKYCLSKNLIPDRLGRKEKPFNEIDAARAAELSEQIRAQLHHIIIEIAAAA